MKNGPVLSQVYDLVKGEAARAGEWGRYVQSEGYAVALQSDPGRGELSRRELEKLAEVYGRYRDSDDWELSDATHAFVEWSKHYREGTSTPIPWQDILEAQGKGELIEIAEREEAERRCLDKLFGDRTRDASLDSLLSLSASGRLIPDEPVTPELLKRIRQYGSLSRDIPVKYIDSLLDQAVIE